MLASFLMLPLTNKRLAIILAPRSLWTIDPADYKDVRLPGLNSSSKMSSCVDSIR